MSIISNAIMQRFHFFKCNGQCWNTRSDRNETSFHMGFSLLFYLRLVEIHTFFISVSIPQLYYVFLLFLIQARLLLYHFLFQLDRLGEKQDKHGISPKNDFDFYCLLAVRRWVPQSIFKNSIKDAQNNSLRPGHYDFFDFSIFKNTSKRNFSQHISVSKSRVAGGSPPCQWLRKYSDLRSRKT